MKKHIVSALSLALCLGLTVGSTVTVFAEDTKTIDSLKIAFSPYADSDTITTATEPLEDLLKETLLTKGYDVENVDMTVGTSYTAVGQALSAGSADIGFISGGNYVLFSDDCDVLLTALRYGINKDSDDPKDWNDGTIEENTDEMSTYYRSIILAGPSEKGQALLEKVNNGEELTWDDLNDATWAVMGPTSASGYIYPSLWLNEKYGKGISDLANAVESDSYTTSLARLASGQIDVLCTYADARRDYEDEWTGEYAMTNTIWDDTAVIGVTPAIYNDTISVSKTSPVMDDDFKAALSEAFINIGNTEEGKEVIAIYSHNGYQPAKAEDYDSERAAQKMIQEMNSAS